ncbi:MAG: beta-mannosidase [Phycisphaerae bacterium]
MQTIDLSGTWSVKQRGSTEETPATVPGCVHTDLLDAGKIPDPFYRDNENDLQWIGFADWMYSRTFDVAPETLEHEHVLLRCEGLDTFAEIRLNGKKLARTDNMFRTYEFDVPDRLRAGENDIVVTFRSTLPYMEKKHRERRMHAWNAAGGQAYHGAAYVRKMPCNYGWDWGPMLVTSGIWRPISIVAFDTARIDDVHVRQDHSRRGSVGLNIDLQTEKTGRSKLTAAISVTLNGKVVAEETVGVTGKTCQALLEVTDPQLWWPNGMGDQPLYDVAVVLKDADGIALDRWTRRVGLREFRLVREKDQWGESFKFSCNGRDFFAKGSNWIPASPWPTAVTRETYDRLLESAANTHQNMIRVWGGGIYEDDYFYDRCDELGLCVWQDFMFACSTYPAYDEDFLTNVAIEAEQNIKRIRSHASLTLWCGNNELEQGLVGNEWSDRQMSWDDYKTLFDKLLPKLVRKFDPQTDYWPSSGHSPGRKRGDSHDPSVGDAHLWGIWHGGKPFEWFHGCEHRFNSEFGFQSFPEPKTVYGYTAPEDRNITHPIMEHHQRSKQVGNKRIGQVMLDWFRMPKDFESLLWLSQIQQGLAIRYGVEHFRRLSPRCMGTLYWQLNDNWPVASWSSIDYHGRWKAVHYMVSRYFAPVALTAVADTENDKLELWTVSDLEKSTRADLNWQLVTPAGAIVDEGSRTVRVPAGRGKQIAGIDAKKAIAEHSRDSLMLFARLTTESGPASETFLPLARPKRYYLEDPGFRISSKSVAAGFEVTLRAEKPALWIWLELEDADADFSDNFFHTRGGVEINIHAQPWQKMTAKEFAGQLKVRSLIDTY